MTFKNDEERAKLWCVVQDLKDIEKALRLGADVHNAREKIYKRYEKMISVIRNEFPDFKEPPLKIVKQFPPPYDKMNWLACAPDKEDEEQYGIEPGIYIKEETITPYYIEVLLAHELTHKIVEQYDTHGFGIGLEEGIADLYGAYLASKVMEPKIVANVLIADRKYGKRSRASALYEFFGTLAYEKIYVPHGMEGVRDVIRMGRQGIRKAGERILRGEHLGISNGDWDKDLERAFEKYVRYPNDLYVSAVAKYVSAHVRTGKTIRKIAEEIGITEKTVEAAIRELQDLTLITVKENTITAVAEDMIRILRYSLK